MAATITDGVYAFGAALFGEHDAYVYEEDILTALEDAPLTDMQRRVLSLRFGLTSGAPLRFCDVAAQVGCDSRSVQQTCSRGIQAIRNDAGTMEALGDLYGVVYG